MNHFNLGSLSSEDTYSQEAIDRQSSKFFIELTEAINQLKNKVRNKTIKENDFQELGLISKKYTNIDVKITLEGGYDPKSAVGSIYAIPNRTHVNHIFNDDFIKPYIQDFINSENIKVTKNKGIKGGVSLSKGIVTGDFTKYKAIINIPRYLFEQEVLTDRQLAAIFLHELGHHFTFMEMMDRVVTVNQILFGLYSNLNSTSDLKERTIVLERASKEIGIKLKVEELKDQATKDNETALRLLISKKIKQSKSQTGHSMYDMTSAEQTADQYAVRWGAGSALAEGLEVIERVFGLKVFQKNHEEFLKAEAMRWYSISFGKTSFIGGLAAILLGSLASAVGVLVIGFILAFAGNYIIAKVINGAGVAHHYYDTPRNRLLRMKEDLINQLKVNNQHSDYYKAILEDIKGIDNVLVKFYHEESYLVKKYTEKNRYDAEKIQRELEILAANDLFIHGHQLKLS